MIELVETLLPNLPDKLLWVKGVFYIIEAIFFFGLMIAPVIMIFSIPVMRKK